MSFIFHAGTNAKKLYFFIRKKLDSTPIRKFKAFGVNLIFFKAKIFEHFTTSHIKLIQKKSDCILDFNFNQHIWYVYPCLNKDIVRCLT